MSNPPKFEMHVRIDDDRCIAFLMGELDLSTAPRYQSAIQPLIGQGNRTLVLNLKGLDYIDSTGIGCILKTLKERDKLKAAYSVEDIPPKIGRLFDMIGMTRFLR